MYKKDYFLDWHETIADIDIHDEAQTDAVDDDDTQRRLRVRMLMDRQGKRFFCFHTWLTCLTALIILEICLLIRKDNNVVECSADGDHWVYETCSTGMILQFSHVFTAMQCGAMARVVFVKTVKQV